MEQAALSDRFSFGGANHIESEGENLLNTMQSLVLPEEFGESLKRF
jgi:hypothetical protein